MINAIFFFSMYPVLFLLYYIYKNEGKLKRHTLFGIRISKEWLSEEESEKMLAQYRRKMNRSLLILAIVPLITLFIPYFSISFTIWMIWLMAAIILLGLPYSLNNRKLLQLKQEKQIDNNPDGVVYSEIKNAGSIRTIKKTDFLLPNLLSIGIGIFSLIRLHGERFELYGVLIITFAACTPLFYGCALWMDRMKTRVISSDSDVNVNYARATKKLWKDFWGICMWVNTLFTIAILAIVLFNTYADAFASHIILWGTIIYVILTLIGCAYMWKKKLALDSQYADKMDMPDNDNERAWIGGVFYYNPKDPHVMVSKKFGMGTTTNMATPAGKATIIIGLIALLSLPVCCIWVMLEEFTPITLTITDNTLIGSHWKTEYEISIDDITQVTLLKELPRRSKVNGTGMDNLEKGVYRNSEDGKYKSFLNPNNNVFLRFTVGDTIYYMSGYNDEETMAIYEAIQ